jgi:ubiquitin-activating enzyme E1
LQQSLAAPGDFLLSDFAKWDRPAVLHQAFRGLHAWKAAHGGALPIPGDAAAAEQVLAAARQLDAAAAAGGPAAAFSLGAAGWTPAAQALTRQLASTAAGVLNPMCAFLGGVAGQEVLKACSGKFTPIKQWFYFDAAECLPDPMPQGEQVTPAGCRYDSAIVVFGRDLQAKVRGGRHARSKSLALGLVFACARTHFVRLLQISSLIRGSFFVFRWKTSSTFWWARAPSGAKCSRTGP